MSKRTTHNAGRTACFAIIGDPVTQSKSPALHNAAFAALKIDAQYQAVKVKADELPDFFTKIRNGKISGINITIPHKQAALKLVDDLTLLARKIGAINTVYVKNGKLIGDNTDAPGFLMALKQDLGFYPAKKNVAIIGAGGAARAVLHALASENICSLVLVNRSLDKADELAGQIAKTSPAIDIKTRVWRGILQKDFSDIDLLVNASSLGMHGIDWPTLDFVGWLKNTCAIIDIVYHPAVTPLIQVAKERGLKCQNGLSMLLYQGVIAFELFTGIKAPLKEMKTALSLAVSGER